MASRDPGDLHHACTLKACRHSSCPLQSRFDIAAGRLRYPMSDSRGSPFRDVPQMAETIEVDLQHSDVPIVRREALLVRSTWCQIKLLVSLFSQQFAQMKEKEFARR